MNKHREIEDTEWAKGGRNGGIAIRRRRKEVGRTWDTSKGEGAKGLDQAECHRETQGGGGRLSECRGRAPPPAYHQGGGKKSRTKRGVLGTKGRSEDWMRTEKNLKRKGLGPRIDSTNVNEKAERGNQEKGYDNDSKQSRGDRGEESHSDQFSWSSIKENVQSSK